MNNEILQIGILTVSDRASAGEYKDISGKAIEEYFSENLKSKWKEHYHVVPDNFSEIKKRLMFLADKANCSVIVTTGGTGPAPRDITPEVTELVCNRLLPGFGELMRAESLKYVRTAILSRQTAGIRNKSLIINLPGKPKAIKQCLEAVFPAIPDCVKLIGGPVIESDNPNVKIHH